MAVMPAKAGIQGFWVQEDLTTPLHLPLMRFARGRNISHHSVLNTHHSLVMNSSRFISTRLSPVQAATSAA